MDSKLKKILLTTLFTGTLIFSNVEVQAAGLLGGAQINVEAILIDKAFSESQNHIYINEESETEVEVVEEQELDGQAVAEYACEFIGNPYVWGGTSLTDGADCSGFVQSVYGHFGIELPRTSSTQQTAGWEVSYENALPGDIICYEGHVGIYIGNGKIVNARNPEEGIGITSAEYNDILAVRRVI